MTLVPASLQRALATLLAALPLLAGTDPCTVGALAGRVSATCAARVEVAPACHAAPAPQTACPHCGPAPEASPARSGPAPAAPTCCDLKPLAAGAEQQPTLSIPSHAPAAGLTVLPALATPARDWYGRAVAVRTAAPPGESLAPLSPRPPPLS